MKKPIKKLIKKQGGGPQDNTREYYPAGSMPISTADNISRRDRFRNQVSAGAYDFISQAPGREGTRNERNTAIDIVNAGRKESGMGRAGRIRTAANYLELNKPTVRAMLKTAPARSMISPNQSPFWGGKCPMPEQKKGGETKTSKKKK